jgi:hypothetical protein
MEMHKLEVGIGLAQFNAGPKQFTEIILRKFVVSVTVL